MQPKVALTKAENRYATVHKALDTVTDDIKASIKGKRRILIKPNMVSVYTQLAATHVEAHRALLDYLKQFDFREIIIGEGSAGNTPTGFQNYGYLPLKKEYGVEFVDLNEDDYVEFPVYVEGFKERTVRVAKTVVDCDCRISCAKLKTHDAVIATLSLKNMVIGSIQNRDRWISHGAQLMNLNLYRIAKRIPVHLALIDGWEGMEGDGPVKGTPVQMGVALAGTDYIAVDTVAAYLMGFDPDGIGYLHYANGRLGEGDLSKIKVVGEDPAKHRVSFKPHRTIASQRQWRIPEDTMRQLLER